MALNDRVNPWIGDQCRRVVAAQEEAIIDKPICHDPQDETDEQRVERKRRREAIGQRYLAGRGAPFILSAQLKGPFDKASGWKNPWLPKEPTPEPEPEPATEPVPIENRRPLALKKALRDQPSLTGRQRNGSVSSVASTRSHISIGSNSQSQGMVIDRPAIVRHPAAKPNLHGGLKHFLGAVSGGNAASTRKLDRDNLPAQLPPLKRKADVSWLKGAEIVRKKRRELPELPSPTPPSRVNNLKGRQFGIPTNLLDEFRQHSQADLVQDSQTPTSKRPVITSSQSQSESYADIPTPLQDYIPPFKRQRRSLLAAPNPNASGPSGKKVFAKSRLSQANRRSTSNASALTDHAINEEPVKPLAKRVMSLNRAEEVFGNESFKFRRTKRVENVNAMETVVSSIERDDEDEENQHSVTMANNDVDTESEDESNGLETQPEKKPVAAKPVVEKSTVKQLVAKLRSAENVAPQDEEKHEKETVRKATKEVPERRVRNSQSLPSDSETESPEKVRLPPAEERRILNSGVNIAPPKHEKPESPDLSSVHAAPEIPEDETIATFGESQSQTAQRHHLSTIQEVTKTTGTHPEDSLPTANTLTTATATSLVTDVVQDEMMHEGEADTSMPDFPPSSDDKHDAQQNAAVAEPAADNITEEAAEEVTETTYVQMASGSLSGGSASNVSQTNISQSTAMNTQTIDALKANLLEEEDDDEDMMTPAPESTSSPDEAARESPKGQAEELLVQSQYAQRNQTTPRPQSNTVGGSATHEDQPSSEPTFYSERKQAGRPQISSSEPTNSRLSTMESQPLITLVESAAFQQSGSAGSSLDKEDGSSEQSQYAERQRPNLAITDSKPTNTGTTRTGSQHAVTSAPRESSQLGNVANPTVDDILRILRSSQRRDVDSSHEKTPTQKSQDNGSATARGDAVPQEQSFKWHASSTQDDANKISSSPPRSQVHSYAESPIKSLQADSLVQSQLQSRPHPHHSSQPQAQAAEEDGSSISTNTENTGTTTTESLLLQAIARDMATEDDGGISMTGLTESTHEKSSGESEATPKRPLSQITATSTRVEEVQVEKSSNEEQILSDGPILAPEVLQEPETQSWHISVVEDSTMLDFVGSDATEDPSAAMLTLVQGAKFTSSPPPPSLIPASVEEAPPAPREDPSMTLSQNPWAIGTPAKASTSKKPKKTLTFSDHPSSSSVDDDDLDGPTQRVSHHMPSSPPPRISHPPLSQSAGPLSPEQPQPSPQQIPILSPPPVWQEPPSTESPFPLIINGLRRNAQHFPTQSSQGMGMANAFLAADRLAQLASVREERDDTLSPPSKQKMAAPRREQREQTPPMQSDAATQKKGQSSVIRQLAQMYPSSDEEMDDDCPIKPRHSRSQSRSQSQSRQEESSLTFLSQEHYAARKSSPPARPVSRASRASRVQVSWSPSTITDPYANPWLTQQPAAPAHQVLEVVEEEEQDYDELPPFALGNILGMLGEDFGSSRMGNGENRDEGVGQVADEMSDLLEAWDVDEELNKARREDVRSGRTRDGDRRSSARERVGRGRF